MRVFVEMQLADGRFHFPRGSDSPVFVAEGKLVHWIYLPGPDGGLPRRTKFKLVGSRAGKNGVTIFQYREGGGKNDTGDAAEH